MILTKREPIRNGEMKFSAMATGCLSPGEGWPVTRLPGDSKSTGASHVGSETFPEYKRAEEGAALRNIDCRSIREHFKFRRSVDDGDLCRRCAFSLVDRSVAVISLFREKYGRCRWWRVRHSLVELLWANK